MALIRVRQLHLAGRISDISLTLERGTMLGVIGPNGSGKSTLLNCLAGILPAMGEIHLDEVSLPSLPPLQRARRIGLLPQSARSAWTLNVADVVSLGRLPWGDEDPEAIAQAIHLAGIEQLSTRRVDRLSGGERARVWLARVLAGQPELLLADEPIASLDLHYQCSVLEVLRDYARRGNGVIIAIHDLSLAARYCDRLCLLDSGRIHSQGPAGEVLQADTLSRVFGIDIHVDLQAHPPVILPG